MKKFALLTTVAALSIFAVSFGAYAAERYIEYTTANGGRPDGRYGFHAEQGLTQEQEEEACARTLQKNFDSVESYKDFELGEIAAFRGNICGFGWKLKTKLGDIDVIRVRKIRPNMYDYDLLLTCEK